MTASNDQRRVRFDDTTGALSWNLSWNRKSAALHPDRCTCQHDDPTPHQHYTSPPHKCARCLECTGYNPAEPETPEASPSASAPPEEVTFAALFERMKAHDTRVAAAFAEYERLGRTAVEQLEQLTESVGRELERERLARDAAEHELLLRAESAEREVTRLKELLVPHLTHIAVADIALLANWIERLLTPRTGESFEDRVQNVVMNMIRFKSLCVEARDSDKREPSA